MATNVVVDLSHHNGNVDLGKEPKQRHEVAQDLAWALLNSPAFLFNR